jgi:DnaK suppressor protein
MPLTQEQKKELREKITERLSKLEKHAVSLEEASRPVEPDNAIGRLTRMDAISAKGVSEASLRSAKAEMAALNAAVERLGSPDFGECSVCGEDIPFGRLLLMPGTTRCVNCAD